MFAKHFYKLASLLFIAILFFISRDYYYKKVAFDSKMTVKALLIEVNCSKLKAERKVLIEYEGKRGYLTPVGNWCTELTVGQNITVLYSPSTDRFYWNREPNKRPFYLFPFAIAFIVYLIVLDRRENSGIANPDQAE